MEKDVFITLHDDLSLLFYRVSALQKTHEAILARIKGFSTLTSMQLGALEADLEKLEGTLETTKKDLAIALYVARKAEGR